MQKNKKYHLKRLQKKSIVFFWICLYFLIIKLHYPRYVYHLVELALRDSITVVDDSGGLEAGGLVELDEKLPHHGGQVLDDVLAVLLHTDCGTVSAGMGVHTTNNLRRKSKMLLNKLKSEQKLL